MPSLPERVDWEREGRWSRAYPPRPTYFQDNLAFDADGDFAFLVAKSGFLGIYRVDTTGTWRAIPGSPFLVGSGARDIAVVNAR